jgi:hypothetical protein
MCSVEWSRAAQSDLGRACVFAAPDGSCLPWLQSLHSISANGRHAIFLAESLVRLEMLRSVRTYELAITLHTISYARLRERPEVASKLVFRGRDGVLPFDLWKEEYRALRGKLTPIFYDRAGEILPLLSQFEEAVRNLTAQVCCIGCKHTHFGVPPVIGG